MKTLLDLERTSTDRLVLRVRREDEKGNVKACATVEARRDQVKELVAKAVEEWARADEMLAQALKEIAKRKKR